LLEKKSIDPKQKNLSKEKKSGRQKQKSDLKKVCVDKFNRKQCQRGIIVPVSASGLFV